MADRADRINDDGSMTLGILADSLGEFDRNAEYRCCGNVNGIKCNAPLTLVISKKGNYFREKSSAKPHRKGCVYNNKAMEKLISHLDRLGSDLKIDDLFSSIANHHLSSSVRTSHNSPAAHRVPDDTSNRTEIKPLVYTKRQPRNLKQLYILLLTKDVHEHYADKTVESIILTQDNIALYRKKGISSGQKLIVKCSSFNYKKYSNLIPPYAVILQDAYSREDGGDPILFIIKNMPREVKDTLFSSLSKSNIVIWGEWFQYKSIQNAYICEKINKNMLYAPGPDGY